MTTPTKPKKVANTRRMYFKILTENPNVLIGTTKLDMATAETMIIIISLTRPASVAACPRINPPTVVAVGPKAYGSRILASVNNSIIMSIKNTSTKDGYGTAARLPAIDRAN